MCTVCRVRIVVLNLLAVSFVEGQGRSLERWGKTVVGEFTLGQRVLVHEDAVNFNSILYFETVFYQGLNCEGFSLSIISIKLKVSASWISLTLYNPLCGFKPFLNLRGQARGRGWRRPFYYLSSVRFALRVWAAGGSYDSFCVRYWLNILSIFIAKAHDD